jgi:hypothetical protein
MIFREIVPDAVKLETFFEYCPMPSAEDYFSLEFERKERLFIQSLVASMVQRKAFVILAPVTCDAIGVPPEILLNVPASRLRLGIFDPIDYRLKDYLWYQGARMWVLEKYQIGIQRDLRGNAHAGESSGGRPRHEAWIWYAARNFQRGSMSMNKLQNLMKRELRCEPPIVSTIRAWEKEAEGKR